MWIGEDAQECRVHMRCCVGQRRSGRVHQYARRNMGGGARVCVRGTTKIGRNLCDT